MNSNNSTALAVAATAAIAVIALCAVLRSDTVRRRGDAGRGDAGNELRQLERWDGEGGSLPDEVAVGVPENGTEHA